MSSVDLADGVHDFITECMKRIHGPGREQYEKRRDNGGVFQAFEQMTPLEILQAAREEVQDLGVYAAMLDIRLARLTAAFKANDTIGDAR
jgi:hypothetical protein